MTDTVRALVTPDVRDRYRRRLVFRYALLGNLLRDVEPWGTDVADQCDRLLTPLDSMTWREAVAVATPFFWMNAQRCLGAATGGGDVQRAGTRLLLTGLDCLFERLSPGTVLTLPLDADEIVLPALGVALPVPGPRVRLARTAAGSLAVEAEGFAQEFAVPLRSGGATLDIPGMPGARLLVAGGGLLFEDEYVAKVVRRPPAAAALAECIGAAVGLIGEVDPVLGADLVEGVKWFAPLSTPDAATTHNSFTAANLIGVMFLSDSYSSFRLAEAMVHEFHHGELYMLSEVEPVTEPNAHAVFYSPWRPDARPLYGLLHALFVFSGVADFYAHAEGVATLARYVDQLRERRHEIVHQLRLGLVQVPVEQLTPSGRRVLEAVAAGARRHAEDVGVHGDILPPILLHHVRTWQAAHPRLATTVRRIAE